MSLAKKLNLKEGMRVRVLGKPANVDLDDVMTTPSAKAEGVLVFVKTLADVDARGAPLIEAAQQDRIAWVAYPKSGQLGTDLHRDVLWKHLQPQGIDSVRLISLDSVWSVMRFRPAADAAPRAKATPAASPARKSSKAGAQKKATTNKPTSIDGSIARMTPSRRSSLPTAMRRTRSGSH